MLNLLTEPLIGLRTTDGAVTNATLPRVFTLLTQDAVAEFPALRPHQRHPWHAFMVQLAALALQRGHATEPAKTETSWALLLRGLTPDWPGDEPWSLVMPAKEPAFMQAPVPDGDMSSFGSVIETPDALDILVTSKNHDLKRALMGQAEPEDWLFSLITLQTFEGVMGAGKYGISRMNGGYGSRPCVGLLPPGGAGKRFLRDLRVLLRERQWILDRVPLKPEHGIGLVWLEPWEGQEQIPFNLLDPFYIEICRRVRLLVTNDVISARSSGSRRARIAAAELKGNTGDPWTPIERSEAKALSITGKGFSYRVITELLLGERYEPSLLQRIQPDDASEGVAVLACAVARGQGKTEGYHERIVPIPRKARSLFVVNRDQIAQLAQERVQTIGKMQKKVLRPALFSLLQEGPEKIDYGSKSTAAEAEPWLKRLDQEADKTFFPDLWQEAETDAAQRHALRLEWLNRLKEGALTLLDRADRSVPHASMRRYRALVRARGLFFARLFKEFPDLRQERPHYHAA